VHGSSRNFAWAKIHVHPAELPAAVENEFARGLQLRSLNPKFLYNTPGQAALWLNLHQRLSPAHRDDSALRAYTAVFDQIASFTPDQPVEVIGLSAGSAWKEAHLLQRLSPRASFTAVDVSLDLLLHALENTAPFPQTSAVLCDAAHWETLLHDRAERPLPRVLTFFGTIHNFEPADIFPRLRGLLRPGDLLVVGANLAPASHYAEAMAAILAQYNNAPTKEWLGGALRARGAVGETNVHLDSAGGADGLERIAADFAFSSVVEIRASSQGIRFAPGERFPIFFSYRYTVEKLTSLAAQHGLVCQASATSAAEDEGVFLFTLK